MSKELKDNIAIIDDDALVRQSLEDCMESAGYIVEGFGSAEEFLASGRAHWAACLIVDIRMPGITGLDLQERLAGENGPPIIFVTAQETAANRERAIQHGAAGFLSKPFRRDELLNSVREAIRR